MSCLIRTAANPLPLDRREESSSKSLVILGRSSKASTTLWARLLHKRENPLLPEDPLERAAARSWAKFGDDKVLPSIWESFTNEGKEQEEAIVEAKENLKYLEEEQKGKKFFGGEKLGFADIALGWLAHYESVFEDVAGMKLLTEEEFPLLSAWKLTFADAPIIKDNWPSRDKLVAKFQATREDQLLKKAPK
ncbi:glutathione transferase GST 23-like isoform X2 [Prunus dulcis]|uniref:glutathione transferase GST 23-like isoform X2 n=1 Tax=Prunus dulcis TaxID=3755 RepID=UPI001483120B|nr:glutathione transferase GST 23-like isoform X2 [Prunus dulcis]